MLRQRYEAFWTGNLLQMPTTKRVDQRNVNLLPNVHFVKVFINNFYFIQVR